MTYRAGLWLLLTLGLAGPVAAQSVTHLEPVTGEQPVDGVTQTQDVALLDDRHDRLTVAVDVAGRGPFRFLVDTGADRTAVSREMVQRLRLTPGSAATLHSVAGASAVATANVPQLQISARQVRSVEAAVLEKAHMGADGVLGTDSLKSQRVLFDLKNNVLSITPANSRPPRLEEGTIVIEARRREGRLIVTEAEADKQPLDVVVDTGAEITIGNLALRKALLDRRQLRPNGTLDLLSVTGETLRGDYLTLKSLTIGGVTLTDLNIVFVDAHTFRQMRMEKRPALLLGMNAIRAFDKVTIDFARRKLRVVLPKGSQTEVEGQYAMR